MNTNVRFGTWSFSEPRLWSFSRASGQGPVKLLRNTTSVARNIENRTCHRFSSAWSGEIASCSLSPACTSSWYSLKPHQGVHKINLCFTVAKWCLQEKVRFCLLVWDAQRCELHCNLICFAPLVTQPGCTKLEMFKPCLNWGLQHTSKDKRNRLHYCDQKNALMSFWIFCNSFSCSVFSLGSFDVGWPLLLFAPLPGFPASSNITKRRSTLQGGNSSIHWTLDGILASLACDWTRRASSWTSPGWIRAWGRAIGTMGKQKTLETGLQREIGLDTVQWICILTAKTNNFQVWNQKHACLNAKVIPSQVH